MLKMQIFDILPKINTYWVFFLLNRDAVPPRHDNLRPSVLQ